MDIPNQEAFAFAFHIARLKVYAVVSPTLCIISTIIKLPTLGHLLLKSILLGMINRRTHGCASSDATHGADQRTHVMPMTSTCDTTDSRTYHMAKLTTNVCSCTCGSTATTQHK